MAAIRFPSIQDRLLLLVVVIAVFLSRAGLERARPTTQSDLAWHLNGAYSLLHGHGLMREVVDSYDWSATVWEPLIYWPPGYSLTAAAIGFFTGDMLQAAWVLQLIFLLLFLATTYLLADHFGVSAQAFALMIVPFGLPFHFLDGFSCTDLPSLAFYQLGVYLVLVGFRERKGPVFHLAAGVVLFIAGTFRYAYYPILLAPPAALFLSGILVKKPRVWKNAMYLMAAIFLCLLLQSAANLYYAGSAAYLEPQSAMKLHPENLSHFNNFVTAAFFGLERSPWITRLAAASPDAGRAIKWFGWGLAGILAAIVVDSARRKWRPIKTSAQTDEGHLLLHLAVATIATNVTLLIYLSLTCAPQTDWTTYWTYVGENRYFAPAMLCFLWWFACLASSGRGQGMMRRLPLAILSASFLFSMAGASVELYRNTPSHSVLVSRDLLSAATKIRNLSGQMAERPVVVSPLDNAPLLALYGARIVRMEEYNSFIEDQKIPSSRPLPVLFWCPQPLSDEEKKFLDVNGAKEILRLRATSLFKMGTW